MQAPNIPSIEEIRLAHQKLGSFIRQTPAWQWQGEFIQKQFGKAAELHLKLELFQHTGTFKARGALLNLMALSEAQLKRGVTAVSAGNHAIAVAYASKMMSSTAKVVMPKTANAYRVEVCRSLGAEIVFVEDVHHAFDQVKHIESSERRTFIHPFEGDYVTLGTATLAYEFHAQVGDLDAMVVPIGGGGLCSGILSAIKQLSPNCKVYGVEPSGANSIDLSLRSGKPETLDTVNTIADSLAAPHAEPRSFSICRKYLDELVLIDDDLLCKAMYELFAHMKLAVEPAGAASTAAALGPLREKLLDKRVGLIICGANIDADSFVEYIKRGACVQ